jgi:hypothetical protein
MPTPYVTPLPVLDRTAPGFRGKVDLYLGAQVPTFSTQINVLAEDLTTKSAAATAAAALATESIATVTAAVTATAASASAASGSAAVASNSATAASGSAATAGTKAADAEAARAASVVAKAAAEAAAATALTLRNQTQTLHDDTVAIAAADILGTAPDKFSNNSMLPGVVRGVALDGLSVATAAAVVSTDTVLQGFGKLQAQAALGIFLPPQTIATNTNAVAGTPYVIAASLVLTLPATPTDGQEVAFANRSGTITASVDPQSKTIRGQSGAMILDSLSASATLKYIASRGEWV